jgi:TP901 family phage tail tape measure protein
MSSIAAGALKVKVVPDMTGFAAKVAKESAAAGAVGSSKFAAAFSSKNLAILGAGLTAGLTVPLVALGASSVKVAGEFESSMSQAAKALGKPIDGMETMKDLALDLGKSTIFSANEVAASITELAKGGFSEAQIEAGALAATLDLAAAGGVGLAESAGYVTAAMNSFNIEAGDAASIGDALAGAADSSAADVDELAAALSNVSAVAGGLAGQTLQDTTAVLAAMSDAGIRGANAGTSLKSAMISLVKPTDASQQAMKRYGIQAYNAQGEMKPLTKIAGELQDAFKGTSQQARNAALATIFGSYGIKAATTLYRQGEEGIRKYSDAASEVGSAQKAAEARMGPTQRALEELSGAWETFRIELGTALAPTVTAIATALSGLVGAFSALPGPVKTAVGALAGFAALAGPVLLLVSAFKQLRAVAGIAGLLSGATAGIDSVGASSKRAGGGVGGLAGKLTLLAAAAYGVHKANSAISEVIADNKFGVMAADVGLLEAQMVRVGQTGDIAFSSLGSGQMSFAEALNATGNAFHATLETLNPFKTGVDNSAVAVQRANEELEKMDTTLATMEPGEAAAAWRAMTSEAEASRVSVSRLQELFPQYTTALEANTLAQRNNANAEREAAGVRAQALSQQEAAKAAAGLARAEAGYVTQLQASNSVIAQRNAGTLQGTALTTAAAAALRQQQMAAAAVTIQQVAGQQPAQKVLSTARQQQNAFVASATAMGYSAVEAQALAAQYGVIPEEVQTYITAKGADEAEAEVERLNGHLATLRAKRTKVTMEGGDPERVSKQVGELNDKIEATKKKRAKVKVEQEGIKETLDGLGKIEGKKLNKKTVKVIAETAKADASIKETEKALKAMANASYEPVVNVDDNASERAQEIQGTLSAIPDENVYVNVITRKEGGGGGGGGGGGESRSSPTPDGRALRSSGSPTASFGGQPRPQVSTTGARSAGGGPNRSSWQEFIDSYLPQWEKDLVDATREATKAANRAADDEQQKYRQKREDDDTAYNRARTDERTAYEKQQQRKATKALERVDDAKRKAEHKNSLGGDKTTDAERKRIDKARVKSQEQRRKTDKNMLVRQRKDEDEAQARSRNRQDADLAADRARQDALDRDTARAAQEADNLTAWARAVEDRISLNERAAQALANQRDTAADADLSLTDWGRSPERLLRDLEQNKQTLRTYNNQISRLIARGLSTEAVGAMGRMSPSDASKLAGRLLGDQKLIPELNAAYASVLGASTALATTETVDQFRGVGAAMTEGIRAGLAGGETSLMSYISTLGGDMLATMKTTLGIASPSKAFMAVGADIGLGLVEGLEGQQRAVARASARLVSVPTGAGAQGHGSPTGVSVTVNPSAGLDEAQTAQLVAREMMWSLR